MPRWKKLVQLGQVTVLFISLQFIGLGSDDLQGHAGRRQPFIGFAVDGKAGMAQVDEEAQDAEVFRTRDVFTDEGAPAVAVLTARLGKAVARQSTRKKGRRCSPSSSSRHRRAALK